MIVFNYETDFLLEDETQYSNWISNILKSENKDEGEINYIFCDDEYLLQINQQYLDHDYYTDIISFDSMFLFMKSFSGFYHMVFCIFVDTKTKPMKKRL
jgi:ssRNA-specific RNase YbeY (16S rRNA maturation enzyme)